MKWKKCILILGCIGLIFGASFYLIWMRSWGPVKGEISTPQGDFGWRENLSPARTEAGGTAMNGKFYVLGGIDSLAQTFSDLQIFDPATNSWQRGKDFPRPINHAGVVADENHLYAVGGFGPLGIRIRGFMFARWDPYDNLERYDPATDQWEALPPMPEPRGAGGVTLGEGKIWYVGGIDAERNLSASLFCYDIASATWSVKPPMKYPRDHMRMEYVDGALYAISGREDDMRFNLAHVEKFDLATETWSELPPLPTPRGGFASAVLDGKIYTFGGESVWTCFETIEAFDTRTNQWETMPPLPEPRHGILAGVIGENIHLVSGGRHPRVSISGLHRTFTPRTTAP